jgi:hypothetical protein
MRTGMLSTDMDEKRSLSFCKHCSTHAVKGTAGTAKVGYPILLPSSSTTVGACRLSFCLPFPLPLLFPVGATTAAVGGVVVGGSVVTVMPHLRTHSVSTASSQAQRAAAGDRGHGAKAVCWHCRTQV